MQLPSVPVTPQAYASHLTPIQPYQAVLLTQVPVYPVKHLVQFHALVLPSSSQVVESAVAAGSVVVLPAQSDGKVSESCMHEVVWCVMADASCVTGEVVDVACAPRLPAAASSPLTHAWSTVGPCGRPE